MVQFTNILWIFILSVLLPFSASQSCTFPEALLGNWTSSNYGLMTFSNATPSLIISQSFDGVGSTTSLNCILTEGTQYILQSTNTIPVFSNTAYVYLYMCFDLREANAYSYYFYLNSEIEPGFNNERLVGLLNRTTETVTDFSQVCTTSVDIAEFHSLVKTGFEREAVQRCPTPLLGNFWFNFYDSGRGPLCDNSTSNLDACNNQNTTHLQFNSSGCTDVTNPGFSADGQLGCLNNIANNTASSSPSSSTYYTSLYNFDTTVDSTSTYRFVCLAVTTFTENSTVFVSVAPNECISGQLATTLPSAQSVRLELHAWYTCVPSDADEKSWLWLILLCVFLVVAVVAILLIAVCCHIHKSTKRKSTGKKALETEEHPLGEVSLPLDVPLSMQPLPELPNEYAVIEEREGLFQNPGKKKDKGARNPIFESSMTLDMKGRIWSHMQNGDASYIDPFTEMDRKVIVAISPGGDKAAKSLRNARRIPFARSRTAVSQPRPVMNGDVKTHLHGPFPMITDGRNYVDLDKLRSVKSAGSELVPSYKVSSTKTDSVLTLPRGSIPTMSVKSPRPKSKKTKANRVPGSKLARSKSATSIRLGSPRSDSRKDKRSKTVIITSSEKDESDVNEFAMAEMASGAGTGATGPNKSRKHKQSTKSARSIRLHRSKTTADKLSPRQKSILKRNSAYSPLEHLSDAELSYHICRQLTPSHMVSVKPAIPNSPYIYVSAVQKQNTDIVAYQPTATQPPWR